MGETKYDSSKIQDNNGSLMVKIPKDWAKKEGLGKGDTVFTTVTPKGLLIMNPSKVVKNVA